MESIDRHERFFANSPSSLALHKIHTPVVPTFQATQLRHQIHNHRICGRCRVAKEFGISSKATRLNFFALSPARHPIICTLLTLPGGQLRCAGGFRVIRRERQSSSSPTSERKSDRLAVLAAERSRRTKSEFQPIAVSVRGLSRRPPTATR